MGYNGATLVAVASRGKGRSMGYPRIEQFESATIILPVLNETASLEETVDVILRDVPEGIEELLIVVCQKTTPEAMATIGRLQEKLREMVVVHHQRLPFLGGATRDAIEVARGSHVVMMASDLETDPHQVKQLIDEARKMPWGIATMSRWRRGGEFHGYSKVKLICNWLFNRFFSLLYGTHLTDMTFGFRILPARLGRAIDWREVRHPFYLESIVKPLRLGVPVVEIPSVWRARIEGGSSNSFFRNFAYFRVGLKTRFARPESLLKSS